jgi:hypothetical protein
MCQNLRAMAGKFKTKKSLLWASVYIHIAYIDLYIPEQRSLSGSAHNEQYMIHFNCHEMHF